MDPKLGSLGWKVKTLNKSFQHTHKKDLLGTEPSASDF